MRSLITEFAQIDPVLLELNLFKSLPRITTSHTLHSTSCFDGHSYEVDAVAPFDDLALKILLVLCALAARCGSSEVPGSPSRPSILWDRLAYHSQTLQDCAVWQGDIGEVLREADMQSGGNNKSRVLDRLKALTAARLSVRGDNVGNSWTSNLIGYSHRTAGGEIVVAFSPGLSARILRRKPVQYSHIRLDPIRTTNSPAARILHAVLSNRIRVGRKAKYSLEKLVEIVYLPSTSNADMRKRKSSIRAAIKELASAGWEFRQASPTAREVLEIHHVGNTASLKVGQMGSTLFPPVQIMTGRIPAGRFAHDPRGRSLTQPRQSHQVSTIFR